MSVYVAKSCTDTTSKNNNKYEATSGKSLKLFMLDDKIFFLLKTNSE